MMSEKIKSFIIKIFTGTVLPFKLVDLKNKARGPEGPEALT